jgi:hypothetical protein
MSQPTQTSRRVVWWIGLPGVAGEVLSCVSRRTQPPQSAAPQLWQIATAGVAIPRVWHS